MDQVVEVPQDVGQAKNTSFEENKRLGRDLVAHAIIRMLDEAHGDPAKLKAMIEGADESLSKATLVANNPAYPQWFKEHQALKEEMKKAKEVERGVSS